MKNAHSEVTPLSSPWETARIGLALFFGMFVLVAFVQAALFMASGQTFCWSLEGGARLATMEADQTAGFGPMVLLGSVVCAAATYHVLNGTGARATQRID
jgi:hypothetical protein